jgi:hypothetical protein
MLRHSLAKSSDLVLDPPKIYAPGPSVSLAVIIILIFLSVAMQPAG